MFLRSHLKVTSQNDYSISVQATCNICHLEEHYTLSLGMWNRWNNGELIQRCFPHLTPAEREILISGTCGNCFDRMFREEEKAEEWS